MAKLDVLLPDHDRGLGSGHVGGVEEASSLAAAQEAAAAAAECAAIGDLECALFLIKAAQHGRPHPDLSA